MNRRAAAAKVQPCEFAIVCARMTNPRMQATFAACGVQAPRHRRTSGVGAVSTSQSLIILLYPPTGDTKVQSVFRHGIAAGSAGRVPLARLSRHHATSVAHILPRPSSPAAVRVLAHISWVLCRPSAPSRGCAAASASRGCSCAACRLWAASPLSSLPESFARRGSCKCTGSTRGRW